VSNYEIISTLVALISTTVSFVVIVRNRKLSEKQLVLENANIKLSALTVLISEYRSKAELFEKALTDGTIEKENLSRVGMEIALEEILEQQYQAVEEIENILMSSQAQET